MSIPLFIILAPFGCMAVVLALAVIPGRVRMERRARSVMAQYPGAEQTSVYLELRSAWASSKQREIDAKIAAMQPEGWAFLRASEANPLRTIRTWGGGVTLHFIKTK